MKARPVLPVRVGVIMNRTNHPLTRLAVLATTIVGLVLVTAGQAAAMYPPPEPGGRPGGRSGRLYQAPIPAPVQPVRDNSNWTLQWVLFTAAVFGALAIVAAVAGALGRRRWRRPPLESALASTDPDELPRVAGLLGDRFVQQDSAGAAEHAYRAAIDVGDEYWSPIAQVALAQLLSDRGRREEAQALLETAIASGHARTVSVAQAALSELSTGAATHAAIGRSLEAYETLSDPASAHRSQARQRGPAAVGGVPDGRALDTKRGSSGNPEQAALACDDNQAHSAAGSTLGTLVRTAFGWWRSSSSSGRRPARCAHP